MQSELKRKTLMCPGCGAKLLKVAECIDLTVECFLCGSRVSATVTKDGKMAIDYIPSTESAFCITSGSSRKTK